MIPVQGITLPSSSGVLLVRAQKPLVEVSLKQIFTLEVTLVWQLNARLTHR